MNSFDTQGRLGRSDAQETWLAGGILRRARRPNAPAEAILAAADLSAARVEAPACRYLRVAPGSQQRPERAVPAFQPVESEVLRRAGVRHGFSARGGGVSTVYLESQQVINSASEESSRSHLTGSLNHGELNLGFTALDARENVLRNRERLLAGIFGEVLPLVTLRQIHSPLIHRVTRLHAGEAAVLHGDGMMTDDPGVVLGIQTADCVPVLLADPTRGAVAVFHAGWRGTLERIVEKGVGQMRLAFGSDPAGMVAAVGPSIGPCCYRVGAEVERQFRSQFADAEHLFCSVPQTGASGSEAKAGDQVRSLPHLDLQEANRRQLRAAGLPDRAIEVSEYCTNCRGDLFFSHRAQQGVTGRMMSVIALQS